VAAHNTAGLGSYSTSSPSLTPNAEPSVPGAPTGTPKDGSISLSWSAPTDQGTAITGYTLAISPAPAGGASTQTVTGTTYTWTGLSNGTGYTFTVAATNNAGTTLPGPASAAVVPFGKPLTPAAPTAVSAPGSGTAVVTWAAPGDNGSAITGYSIQVFQNGTSTQAVSAGAAATSTTINVTNGDTYTFTVTAINAAGSSAASPQSAVLAPAGVPSAVAAVTATPGDSQATLSYTAPAANGAAISGYMVSVSGGAPQALSGNTVTGLSNGTTYTFAVQACNSVGCGSMSPASPGVIPYGAPIMTSVNASDNGDTINFSWSANPNGASISTYNITVSGQGTQQTGATSYSIGVGCGTSADITVSAVNAAGTGAGATSNTVSSPACPPPPAVSISFGGTSGVCGDCQWINITATNFTPNTGYTFTCNFVPGGPSSYSFGSNTDSNGNVSIAPGNVQKANDCAAGSNVTVTVTVNGVTSNSISKP
jgi:hypothetical protein